MNIHDVNELIWHFVGHLRLDEDHARGRIQYEDAQAGRVLEDGIGRVKEAAPRFEDQEDSSSSPVAFDVFAGVPTIPKAGFPISPNHMPPVPVAPVEDLHFKVPPRLAPAPTPGSIGGAHGYPESIGPDYRQTLFDARQTNQINDCDVFYSDSAWAGELPTPKQTHSLDELLASAQQEIPAEFAALSSGGSQAVIAFARTLGSEESAGQDVFTARIEPGNYRNGERLDDDETLPIDLGASVPEMPEPTNGPTGDLGITTQAVETGANVAWNGALIADANGACGTLVVLGDKISLNAIIQVNVYSDNDHINASGIIGGEISSGGNQADNLAEVSFTEIETLPAATSGTPFRVDIVEGDFFDVRAMYQRNLAYDDDVVVQTSWGHYSLVRTGGNEMYNLAELRDFDFSNYYDVIVVGGRYYDINMIVQMNVLLDNDAISVGGGAGSGTVNSGGNSLLNSAQLAMYGTGNVQPLADGMHDFADSLASGSPSGASSEWGFSDGGDGYIDVLYVTGDYFDINLLWQMNVVSDVDVAVLEAGGSSSTTTTTTQVASTGANDLQNQAIIVDVGPLSGEYIGGNIYEGSILIQANLIASDSDTVIGDTETLATEVIAFMECPDTASSDPAYVGPPMTATDHIMSGFMTG